MATGLRVALLANLKKNAPHIPGQADDVWADLDSESTVEAIRQAICAGGHAAVFYEGDITLTDKLRENRPDICFNICEGHWGDSRESHIPAILEMLRIPYTGSKVLTLALTLDKPMTKRVLGWHGLPTPAWQVFESADAPLNKDLTFPLFVKPSREGTGMGVSPQSICNTEADVRQQVAIILEKYRQPALVEQFIEGREVMVGILGNLAVGHTPRTTEEYIAAGLRFLPPLEVDMSAFQEERGVYSNRLKLQVAWDLTYLCPAPLSQEQTAHINWLTAEVFRVTGCLDFARVDLRLSKHENDKPYILEVNPLPGLTPEISDFCIEAKALGIEHTALINLILDEAIKRYGLQLPKTYHFPA
jgi:D-alanine-D-alanine ligase